METGTPAQAPAPAELTPYVTPPHAPPSHVPPVLRPASGSIRFDDGGAHGGHGEGHTG
ncbi:hypothetical protein ACWCQ0_08235 [Streptomyces massasporeus]|uniref:Uncharacterized protein n=1 Tax=Streptomyces massasporeus TaxID=67324 RepID=A0ABW6L4B6_9ACTN